ncbi:hypothetical protein V7S43_004651 [Phytophthora oleae]|uniref:PDEase domain-containing protein n=1 Tax=Phytophthora oleae TaxID=2107226 RepID=A0ABD3FV68_9STRA
MVTTASIRDRGGDEPPAGAKRARTSLDQEECKSNAPEAVQHVPYERLKNVSLPYEITALPHVLSLLDTLLMTPEEALREAIVTNHLKWVQEILNRFPGDFSDAMAEAAGLTVWTSST